MENKIKSRAALRIFIALAGVWGLSSWAENIEVFGLRTRMGEMWLSGLSVGETYNLRVLKNLPYILENQGEREVEVEVEIEQPHEKSLQEGYEPIPDPSWVNVVPKKFTIPFGGSSYGEIIIAVPNDPRWINRHYQARIKSRTAGTGMISASVSTKLMFSTGAPPVTKRQQVRVPEFEFDPPVMTLFNFPVGKKVNVEKDLGRVTRVVNKSTSKFKMGFERTGFDNVNLPSGYEIAPASATFSLATKLLKLNPDTIGRLGVTIELPADAYGKKYAFLVKGDLKDLPIEVLSYFMILVQAEKKAP